MIDTDVGILTVPELEALVSLNVDLADRYQTIADDSDAGPEARRTAQALAAWRRRRARYFQRSAQTPSASRPWTSPIHAPPLVTCRSRLNPRIGEPPPVRSREHRDPAALRIAEPPSNATRRERPAPRARNEQAGQQAPKLRLCQARGRVARTLSHLPERRTAGV
jgi:hypothetical protein